MKHVLLAALLILFPGIVYADEAPSTVSVSIVGAEPDVGQVIVTLFDSEETYMKAPTAETTSPVDQLGEAAVIFAGLHTGDYAVSVIYDKNSNGKLDTGFLGIPKEKIGFSNNAKSRMGPAPWAKALFNVATGDNKIVISLSRVQRD